METSIQIDSMSKLQRKALETIKTLLAKQQSEGLTPYELARLVNAKRKLELRSVSGIYKLLQKSEDSAIVLGKSPFPTFKEFVNVAKDKKQFNYWSGLLLLAKFNKAEALKSRAAKQEIKQLELV